MLLILIPNSVSHSVAAVGDDGDDGGGAHT